MIWATQRCVAGASAHRDERVPLLGGRATHLDSSDFDGD